MHAEHLAGMVIELWCGPPGSAGEDFKRDVQHYLFPIELKLACLNIIEAVGAGCSCQKVMYQLAYAQQPMLTLH